METEVFQFKGADRMVTSLGTNDSDHGATFVFTSHTSSTDDNDTNTPAQEDLSQNITDQDQGQDHGQDQDQGQKQDPDQDQSIAPEEGATPKELVFEQDPFAFGDKVLEKWYPTLEEGNDKGNLLLVQTTKEGAIVGGPKFLKAVGDDVLDSVLSKNIPINLEQDKFNEALTSSVERIAAVLEGKADPGPPKTFEGKKGANYRTKEETTNKREVFSNVVIGLLVISFVVPMLQYFGYVAGDPTSRD